MYTVVDAVGCATNPPPNMASEPYAAVNMRAADGSGAKYKQNYKEDLRYFLSYNGQ